MSIISSANTKFRAFAQEQVRTLLRVGDWIFLTALLLGVVWWFAPQQLSVVLYKVVLVLLAFVLAYMIDRSLFRKLKGISTSTPGDVLSAARVLARAIVLFAIVQGLTGGI